MSDNLRRYRAIRDALTQGSPGQPTGIVARRVTTLAALISGIVGRKNHLMLPVGWRRERLARYLGITPLYVAQLERGTRRITERTVRSTRVLHLIYRSARAVGLLER